MNDTAASSTFNLGKLVEDAKAVVTDPVGFYRSMAKTGGYAEPVIFVVVMAAITGLMVAVFSMFGIGQVGGMAVGAFAVIVMPIMAVIGSFIGAVIMFIIWKLMGSPHGFETAYRSVAYATAIYPITFFLSLVPYIGSIVSVCWGMYLMFIASQDVHGVARQTAMMVFGVLALLVVFFQVSSEIAARKIASNMEEFGESMEGFGKSMEELGKAMEDSESVKTMEKLGEAMENSESAKTMEKLGKDMEGIEDLSPEEAGRKLGEFFKGMEKALQETQEAGSAEAVQETQDAGSAEAE
ncbi:MAG: YIP1 family protein [Pseudomonadales bacterium]